ASLVIFNKKKVICLWIVHHVPVCLPEGSGSVKSGGGGNAREIRIRKTKKKGRRDEDSDEETGPSQQNRSKQTAAPFMAQEDIVAVLEERVSDCPEEILCELAEHLVRPLNKAYQEVLRSVFLSSSSAPSRANKKQSMKDLQEEISSLYNNIRLFEKGTKFFSGKFNTKWKSEMMGIFLSPEHLRQTHAVLLE
ncbi:E3 UFM1-protein ligase 1-like, partial [Notothenia coriiceps]|uniref:E3 UFM1-protein ligase 1-like n=1 Tax=Notothenia coriiceps TaxID=8208 RepID=A0A6I9N218_9TELE